jgi:hypothetical protein
MLDRSHRRVQADIVHRDTAVAGVVGDYREILVGEPASTMTFSGHLSNRL